MHLEKKINNSPEPVSISGTKTILNQLINSICKIKIQATNGTGFFCRIPSNNNNPIDYLMTNYHVIDKTYYNLNKEINLFLNDEKQLISLNTGIKRKTYFNEEFDLTLIEIKENDNINNFIELDENIFKEKENVYYEHKSIYSLQYPKGKNAVVSYGLINKIEDFSIKHTCTTDYGSSGSPILNLENNKVIGIHRKGSNVFDFNIGTFLKFPLNDFFEKNKNNMINKFNYTMNIKNNNQPQINKIFHQNSNNNIIENDNILDNLSMTNNLGNYPSIFNGGNEFNIINNINLIPNGNHNNEENKPKMNIIFEDSLGIKTNLLLSYGTTIDQMLQKYLKLKNISFFECYNKQIVFVENAINLNLGDNTPIEKYFRYGRFPKITVIEAKNLTIDNTNNIN